MIREKLPHLESYLAIFIKPFLILPMSANFYTIVTVFFGLLGFLAVIFVHPLVGFFIFLISGFFDLVDGAVARYKHTASVRGAFLDGCMDRFVDFFLVWSYFFIGLKAVILPIDQWICIQAYFMLMPTFIVAYANHRGIVEDPHEKKVWRILHRGEMYPLMCMVLLLANFSTLWASIFFYLVTLLTLVTTVQTLGLALYLGWKNDMDNNEEKLQQVNER